MSRENLHFLTLFLIISVSVSSCDIADKARYDNYRLYRLHLETEEQVKMLQELEKMSDSYIFIGHARHPDQDLTIIVAAHKIAEAADLFKRYNITAQVLVFNIQEKIEKEWDNVLPEKTPGYQLDWQHYFHLETINQWLDLQLSNHKDLTSVSLGNSFEGRNIRGVKLSRKAGNTAVFVEGGIHAREWISPATSTYILNQLLTSSDPRVKELSENFDWFFFPVVNPDGYVYTFENDRLWRKNRKPYGPICRGVDLNRNFNSSWNGPGSSSDPCTYDFAGGSVNSEPEVAAIAQFIKTHVKESRIKTFLSLHSYSQLLMFPFGSTTEQVPNYSDLKEIGQKAIDALAKKHGTKFKTGSIIETIYPSSGGSSDWAYEEVGIKISYTFELRGPPDSTDMFILPANQITPVGEETLEAFIVIMNEAKARGYYNDA
ncbi:zinc carboxypeptidase-like isoform X1 [Lutzomyia longipalpis]|uniref:zinc carboxypeptidase-like isoform X1 n=1 Tax=Lutzomyia longipalpis TaxID=7200 RepID=UPI002483A7A9|nr:zinc carboxypeptidase-like isoform X1 [Lutzomyia longipalpis]